MMKLKKIAAIFVCLSMMWTITYANEENDAAEAVQDNTKASEPSAYTLSLKDAISLALENNPQLEVCDIKKENNKVQMDSARITKAYYSKAVVSSPNINYTKKGYDVETFESALRLSDKEKDKITAAIAYNVTEKYYNYKLSEKLVEIADNAFKLSLENKNIVDAQFELGLISELEAKNAQIAVSQNEYTLESSVRNLELVKENLKIDLQLEHEDCDFILTDDIEFTDYNSNVNEDAATSVNTRYDAASIYEAYYMAKLYLDFTTEPKNTAAYNSAYSSFIQSEYNYNNSLKMLPLKIRAAYNDILKTKNNVEIAEKTLEIKKQEYEIDKLRFELGIITNIALTTTLNNMSSQEMNLENAKLAYKLAVEKYQYEISIGL